MGKSTINSHFPLLFVCSPEGNVVKHENTLWLFNIAMDDDPFIDDVPIKSDDFPWLCLLIQG